MPTDSLAGGKGACSLGPVKLRGCRMNGGVRLEIHKTSMVPTDALLAGASHIYTKMCVEMDVHNSPISAPLRV